MLGPPKTQAKKNTKPPHCTNEVAARKPNTAGKLGLPTATSFFHGIVGFRWIAVVTRVFVTTELRATAKNACCVHKAHGASIIDLNSERGNEQDKKKNLEDDWPESIFPQALIQPRRHLFTSLRRACLRAAMLSVYGHMRAPSHHPTFLSDCAARFLTKVVCASCIVPGCCAQVALCKLLHAAARKCSVQVAPLRASCSAQVLCASCSAQALCACALCKLVCASCSAPVAPCKRFAHVLCASCSAQVL